MEIRLFPLFAFFVNFACMALQIANQLAKLVFGHFMHFALLGSFIKKVENLHKQISSFLCRNKDNHSKEKKVVVLALFSKQP